MLPQPCHYERVHVIEILQAVGLGKGRGFRHIRHDKSKDLDHVLALALIVRRVLRRLESIASSLGHDIRERLKPGSQISLLKPSVTSLLRPKIREAL